MDASAPAIVAAAEQVSRGRRSDVDRARALFEFVRDRIAYAFVPLDMGPASERSWASPTCSAG